MEGILLHQHLLPWSYQEILLSSAFHLQHQKKMMNVLLIFYCLAYKMIHSKGFIRFLSEKDHLLDCCYYYYCSRNYPSVKYFQQKLVFLQDTVMIIVFYQQDLDAYCMLENQNLLCLLRQHSIDCHDIHGLEHLI